MIFLIVPYGTCISFFFLEMTPYIIMYNLIILIDFILYLFRETERNVRKVEPPYGATIRITFGQL